MIRKPLRKLFGLFMSKRAAEAAAEVADRALVKEADKHTGGIVGKVDRVL